LKEQNVKYRDMVLLEYKDAGDNPLRVSLNARMWDEPINTMPELGKTEVWKLINTTMDAHPIHLHLVQFQVLSRQKFDFAAYLAAWHPNPYPGSGPDPINVDPFLIPNTVRWRESNENGFKDTVRAMPGEVTRIIAKFDDYIGRYPWHCHIIEHEDNEMMLQFEVIPRNAPNGISEADIPLDNYPNPFNPETQIRFEMPITGEVQLKVYNTLGQEVRALASETFTAGSHSILWDGLNNLGSPVASGTYIARLTAAGITKNVKMVLLR
jgi:hypothetical protein